MNDVETLLTEVLREKARGVDPSRLPAARRRRPRSPWVVVAVAAAATVLASVGPIVLAQHGQSASDRASDSDGVDLPTHGGEPADPHALGDFVGTLDVQDDCLVLRGGTAGAIAVRWPRGYRYYRGERAVKAPDGVTVAHVGDRLALGGGLSPAAVPACMAAATVDAYTVAVQ